MANLALRKELKGIIKKRLDKTTDCAYKKAYIPKGWAHVNKRMFSAGLAKEIEIELEKLD